MLLSQIRSLETQLSILKRQVEQSSNEKQPRSFADLYGIAGPCDVPEEEIDAVLYRFDQEI